MFRLFCEEQFRRSSVCETPTREINHSSSVPQDGEKDGRVENDDTHISHEQMVVQAQDVDAPQPRSQVVDRRN